MMKRFWIGMAGMALGCVVAGNAQTAGTAPVAPAPQAGATANPFPAVNPKNFTATSPTVADVDAFLKANWGYDDNRMWQVAAIQKTAAPGVAKIVVYVANRAQPGRASSTVFFTTPDGKHAISGDVVDFGAQPFAENRAMLKAGADGPSRGAKSDALEFVEFSDFQCSRCKDAQATIEQLATDFPQAKIVFENFPQTESHPYALEAAAEGLCIRKAKGNEAFFSFAQILFDTQVAMTAGAHESTLASAATRAGADPAAMAACAATPAAQAEVMAEHKLGEDVGISLSPVLFVNGHPMLLGDMPYETVKKMVAFQAVQDGVAVHLQPTLSTLP